MRTILRETIDNQSAEVALRAWQARPYMLPLWQDQVDMPPPPQDAQSLAFDTTDGAFATGPALIIWESPQTWQLCHVLHVRPDGVDIDPPITTAFTRPCLALPSVLARLLQGAERADRAVRVSDMSLVFSAVKPQDSPGQASPVQYRGQDVELLPLLLSGTTLARRIERGFDVVDYDVGSLDVFDPVRFSVVTFERRFMLETRQDIRDFRAFLYRRGGRVRPFWYPSMREDVTLLADIRTQETELKIRDCGYARLVNDLPGLRDIMIETHDGRRWFRRVAPGGMAGSGSESAETLLLDTPLPVAVPRAEVRRVCWLALLRLDADAVEMEWRTTWQVRSAIPVREIR